MSFLSLSTLSRLYVDLKQQLDSLRHTITVGGGGGGGLTLASPDGSIWGLTVTNGGAINPMKLAESGEGGTVHVFSPDNTEWNLTISNEGVLSTTQI